MITIHDPICGTIDVSRDEIKLIDVPAFQRLRYIKQLGFAELAFPGATHSRYAHSLGAMQVATLMFDRIVEDLPVRKDALPRLKQAVRLAVLFHDLGHPPLSHVTEKVMPLKEKLQLESWLVSEGSPQATHEDYTLKILCDSELAIEIAKHTDLTGQHLAALVSGRPYPKDPNAFVVDGCDLLPLLHQIVSSELDADRMDYLRRDAYYCGVSYGQFDFPWLIENLTATADQNKYVLALKHRGVWAFENFLLARYHMFLAVYFHHTSIGFEYLLRRHFETGEYSLPVDIENYLLTDDIQLMQHLRQSKDSWAQKIVNRRSYRLLLETHDYGASHARDGLLEQLQKNQIQFFCTQSKGILSKYFKNFLHPSLLVVEPELGKISRLEDYTPMYRRFEEVVGVSRIYCAPEHIEQARLILSHQVEKTFS